MVEPVSRTRIDASPTKEFFIFMLTKDISLIRAIADLVDNSVDGARRLRLNRQYDGLSIRIEIDKAHFIIADNCGGISVDLARKYAFRFGRAEGMPDMPYSIGQFGVGMKRSLFKLGNVFSIESQTENSRFVVTQNVLEWAKDKSNWDFHFSDIDDNWQLPAGQESGTKITVTELHQTVSDEFRLENFQTRLISEIEAAHQSSLDKGLAITLNGIPLKHRPAELLLSSNLKPAHKELSISVEDNQVKVKIFAGLSKSEPSKAGWHIFCNGRLILEADKTQTTGWGDGNPQFHNRYARFRGYAYFDSDVAKFLPWNTTKSDVDYSSSVFRSVRLEMITLMRPILEFLKKVESEKENKDEKEDPTPLELFINDAKPEIIERFEYNQPQIFIAPARLKGKDKPQMGRISYAKPLKEIEKIKKILNVDTYKEVGEKTFEYYFDLECEE